MATISITIPDALVPRVRDAVRGNYATVAIGGDPANLNPLKDLNDGAAIKWVLADFIKKMVSDWEAKQAAATASATATTTANTDMSTIV
jgi:hypothetical protein